MTKVKNVSVSRLAWCSYDNIYKISWDIDGKKTNAFSTRGKRIGEVIAQAQMDAELIEAQTRGQIAVDYLMGKLTRSEAVKEINKLKFLTPQNPGGHLLTLAELALGLK